MVKSSYYQIKLLSQRRSFEDALKDPNIDDETKRKIRLISVVKKYAEQKLSLIHTNNYETFVLLDDKYVVYAVTASYKDRLEAFTWSFPIVGKVPYKGFFKKTDADDEKAALENQNLDVMERGVSAYSTLGWFSDPLLSSMTAFDDHDLVETVIHETTHATLYIKNNADFNERLATFVGNQGMESFYEETEGGDSPNIAKAHLISEDSKIFSQFISDEIKKLEKFYSENKGSATLMDDRDKTFALIKSNFDQSCSLKLKSATFKNFSKQKLNNAVFLSYKTYYQDLTLFQKAFDKLGRDWPKFISHFKEIKKSTDPAKELQEFVQ